ncbi:MAG: integrase domain-containing protein [Lachnospiraceae bacterium]|nr:integrase domain-containing protein [Lachnospiraceae bacterium]
MHNLKHQLTHVVRESLRPGQDKHAQKGKRKPQDGRIYSYSTFDDRKKIVEEFGTWVQNQHPEIKLAIEIDTCTVQEYLDQKAKCGCKQDTLDTYRSNLRSLAREIESVYGTTKIEIAKIERPKAVDPAPIRTSKGMDDDDFKRLVDSYRHPTDAGRCALLLSRAAGLRVAGCCWVLKEDIELKDDMAIVHVREKGGRYRDVQIKDPQKIEILKELYEQTAPRQHIVHRRDGRKIKVKSVMASVRRKKDKLGLRGKYFYQGNHALRKSWAQDEYDGFRKDHGKAETIQHVNVQLGHGVYREEAMAARYVSNMH